MSTLRAPVTPRGVPVNDWDRGHWHAVHAPAAAGFENADLARAVLEACVLACRLCAEECARHSHMEQCRVCADACRACEQSCQRVLAALPATK